MKQYLLRLDDASEYMDAVKWKKLEEMLDIYRIKPIVGVIPDNQDPSLVGLYERDSEFWSMVHRWKEKGWTIALHGCTHVYNTDEGGLNPVNHRSEFAGNSLAVQREKIRKGVEIFREHDVSAELFFAPSHTFDANTLEALRMESDIRVISDTIASDVYFWNGFFFVPQQSGLVRKLPFKVVTFCYHPNIMDEESFVRLEEFMKANKDRFICYDSSILKRRSLSMLDKVLKQIYFFRR